MKKFLITSALALCLCLPQGFAANPKREFRGAWLHTVHQSQYAKMTPAETQKYLRDQLDKLQATGCNAILFQVRPSADAFYPSELEPWSRFLSGTAGKAPSPTWDPLQFMIDESHARGMELHAWLNPYRVTTSKNEKLPSNHIYHKHPERFVTYDGKLYFDPGLQENREFIEAVVKDIITRYDVDAIHMDDYFYPYPVAGKDFPDDASFAKYGNGMSRGDWRRHNVDLLIEGLHNVIVDTKPWVRLGISPFGIWRNKETDPRGSDTKGLQNYDALYADVLLWTEKGWVDYMLPQLYWELEKKIASSEKLAYWWNDNANGRHMYIGQDVKKTMDMPDLPPSKNPTQLDHKIRLTRELPNIQGNCWWPGYMITSNYKGIADSLATNQHNLSVDRLHHPRRSDQPASRRQQADMDSAGNARRHAASSRLCGLPLRQGRSRQSRQAGSYRGRHLCAGIHVAKLSEKRYNLCSHRARPRQQRKPQRHFYPHRITGRHILPDTKRGCVGWRIPACFILESN